MLRKLAVRSSLHRPARGWWKSTVAVRDVMFLCQTIRHNPVAARRQLIKVFLAFKSLGEGGCFGIAETFIKIKCFFKWPNH
jgi:hypothetical protein